MANKVTQADIKLFNELYIKYKTYAEVARQTGWSTSTVKRYIVPGYVPEAQLVVQKFDDSLIPPISTIYFKGIKNFGDLCELADTERDEIALLWEEISL